MINLFCNFSEDKNQIIYFILSSSNLTYNVCKENELNKHKNDNNLFVIDPQTKNNDFDKILFNNSKLQIKNIFYLLPISLQKIYDNKIENKAFYPCPSSAGTGRRFLFCA